MAVVKNKAVDVAGPFDGNLVGQDGQHGFINEPEGVLDPGFPDGDERLAHQTERCHRRSVEPVGHRPQFRDFLCKCIRVSDEVGDPRIEVGQICVSRALRCAVEQPTGAVHPPLTDVEIAAGQPGECDLNCLRGRRSGLCPDHLGEHLLSEANRFLAPTQTPRRGRQRVQVVGIQRRGFLRLREAGIAGPPVPPEVRLAGSPQNFPARVGVGVHGKPCQP